MNELSNSFFNQDIGGCIKLLISNLRKLNKKGIFTITDLVWETNEHDLRNHIKIAEKELQKILQFFEAYNLEFGVLPPHIAPPEQIHEMC